MLTRLLSPLSWCLVAVATVIGTPTDATAQSCDDCPDPSVVVYDLENRIDFTNATDPFDRLRLSFVSGGVMSAVADMDAPFYGCARISHGVMFDYLHSGSKVLKIMPNWGTPIRPGPLPGADYVLSGWIEGVQAKGTYTVTVKLETATTRELVATNSTTLIGSDPAAILAVGKSVVAPLLPLPVTIRRFELTRLQSDPKTCLDPDVTITPEKSKARSGESVPVTIELRDCPNQRRFPLVGREVRLSSRGGTITPSTVTMDGSGKAKATFTADASAPVQFVEATYYPAFTPTGAKVGDYDEAPIAIERRRRDIWTIEVAGFGHLSTRRAQSTPDSLDYTYSFQQSQFKLIGVFESTAPTPQETQLSTDDVTHTLDVAGTGSATVSLRSSRRSQVLGVLEGEDRQDDYHAHAAARQSGVTRSVTFYHGPGKGQGWYLNAGISLEGQGDYEIKRHTDQWTPYRARDEQYPIAFGVACGSEAGDGTLTPTADGFTVTCRHYKQIVEDGETKSESDRVSAVIRRVVVFE